MERREGGRKTLLFLGRLHPKKGLTGVLEAWAALGSRAVEGWRLEIAGWDQGGHEAELKRLASDLGIGWADVRGREGEDGTGSADGAASVFFSGPAFGEAKDGLLRRADAFILPSFSEGLPMSVLEAWAYRLPVLMTDYCNLPEGFAAGAARRIGTDADSIGAGLRALFTETGDGLREMGGKGRALVESRFTWRQVAEQMGEVYRWVLGNGLRPSCVEVQG
jgi:poly(glycerol-phosphate) alpha-glucosyltransferase